MQGATEESEILSQARDSSRYSVQEAEKLAVDRAIACHLLQIVYDASPLVRAEVALSLSRLVSGHNVLFQVSSLSTASLNLTPLTNFLDQQKQDESLPCWLLA